MPPNVLIVDDSPTMRKIIRKNLELAGYRKANVSEAADGIQALALLQDQTVDLVIIDVNMPKMNGEEFLERIRNDPAQLFLPVLVVSSDRSQERIDRMMALGAAAYVTKPFSPEVLGTEMIKILGEKQHDDDSF